MEMGLEQARGALLRSLPGDALAILDGVWQRARRTEEGWYLRSASLTVLGLPGESERVAEEGLAQRPESLALRFVQSVARFAMGDMAGARAVLQPAIASAPKEPVLLVQHALLLAKQGDTRGANDVLTVLERYAPDHPALVWGRTALRGITTEAARQRSRATPLDWPSTITPRIVTAVRPSPASPAQDFSTDVAASALERFGARVAKRPPNEIAREARMLMRAFSAGGSLSAATTAEQAHAARTVLNTFSGVASRERFDTPSPIRSIVEQLLPLIQDGSINEAERLVRKQSALTREPIGRLLLSVLRGAHIAIHREVASGDVTSRDMTSHDAMSRDGIGSNEQDVRDVHATSTRSAGATFVSDDNAVIDADTDAVRREKVQDVVPEIVHEIVHEATERGAVVPMRLGLSLLEETPASRSHLATPSVNDQAVALAVNAEQSGRRSTARWTAIGAEGDRFDRTEWSDGAGVRAVALVCVALAATAAFTGHGVVAIALGMGAAWLGLRRSGRERRSAAHEQGESQ